MNTATARHGTASGEPGLSSGAAGDANSRGDRGGRSSSPGPPPRLDPLREDLCRLALWIMVRAPGAEWRSHYGIYIWTPWSLYERARSRRLAKDTQELLYTARHLLRLLRDVPDRVGACEQEAKLYDRWGITWMVDPRDPPASFKETTDAPDTHDSDDPPTGVIPFPPRG